MCIYNSLKVKGLTLKKENGSFKILTHSWVQNSKENLSVPKQTRKQGQRVEWELKADALVKSITGHSE